MILVVLQRISKNEIPHFCCLLNLVIFPIWHLTLEFETGSLIKLVYFSRHEDRVVNDKRKKSANERFGVIYGISFPVLGGRLHFVKFETAKINECLEFTHSKQFHGEDNDNAVIKATGGGAFKFADLFKEKLGVSIDKEDEMDCLVAGDST